MTDRGTYIKMSDSLPEHRKIVAAGGDAAWLHVCALAYCSRNRTDGFIPENMVPRLSDRRQPAKLAARLCDVDLWHGPGHDCKRCPQPPAGEYIIHDYLEHQWSAARIAEVSAKRAASGKRGGTKSQANSKQIASDLLRGGFDSAEAKPTPDIDTDTDTDTEVPTTSGAEAPATTDQLIADWLDHVRKRPPQSVIGQVGKHIHAMLAEGIDALDIRHGLAAWARKGLHPSALPSCVNELMNASSGVTGRRQAETDAMFDRAARRIQAREGS